MRLAELTTPRTAGVLLALISALGLAGALVIQFGFGEAPCTLCIWQRYPHLAVVGLGLLAWFWQPRLMVAAAGLVLAGSVVLAAYHVGIEQGVWALPASCLADQQAGSVAELRALLQDAPAACDEVSVRFAGLSLAAWNGLASLAMAGFAFAAVLRRRSIAQ
jgi:disulfide bond formation protein DsbB